MKPANQNPVGADTNLAGLAWLIQLRWSATIGQAALIFVSSQLIKELAIYPLYGVVLLLALSNLCVTFLRPSAIRTNFNLVGVIILTDIFLLTALLYWSGGAANPFSLFYILHVALAAVMLGEKWTWLVSCLSMLLYGALFIFHVELPELATHGNHDGLSVHLQGMWLAFVIVAAVLAFFFTRLLSAIRVRDEELKKAESLRLRQERVTAVTALAASAAHELNSPLATITLAAEEIGNVIQDHAQFESIKDDADLIRTEVRRCSEILGRLRASACDLEGDLPQEILVESLVEQVVARLGPAQRQGVELEPSAKTLSIKAPPKPLVEALVALVRNGLEASDGKVVKICFRREEFSQQIQIVDQGPGISPAILARLGEPFLTTKAPGVGMGLGVFLAKRFAEAMGGDLSFVSSSSTGTIAVLRLST